MGSPEVVFGTSAKETAPRLIYRFRQPARKYVQYSPLLRVENQQELSGLFPEWPVPYALVVTWNDCEFLSLSLIDWFGNTIQVNLQLLERFELIKQVLLGGSSRINPSSGQYGVAPSSLTAKWLRECIIPWLEFRGAICLFVRAHFSKADKFFSEIGFAPSIDIGPPYMICNLQDPEQPRDLALRKHTPVPEHRDYLGEFEKQLHGRQVASFEANFTYFYEVRRADTETMKTLQHARLSRIFEGVSLSEFQVQWAMAMYGRAIWQSQLALQTYAS